MYNQKPINSSTTPFYPMILLPYNLASMLLSANLVFWKKVWSSHFQHYFLSDTEKLNECRGPDISGNSNAHFFFHMYNPIHLIIVSDNYWSSVSYLFIHFKGCGENVNYTKEIMLILWVHLSNRVWNGHVMGNNMWVQNTMWSLRTCEFRTDLILLPSPVLIYLIAFGLYGE